MHFAAASLRSSIVLALLAGVCNAVPAQAGDRTPLVGTGSGTVDKPVVITGESGQIVALDTLNVPCPQTITFSELSGGDPPGTNYDGIVMSGDLLFSEHFLGQTAAPAGVYDVVLGAPTNPLTPEVGATLQNLDIFDYAGNVLTGLGPLGYPDGDAIGEGSIAIYYPALQSKVKLSIVGGNGGAATISFYRRDGSLIDVVVVSGLTDISYGFGTSDDSHIISGILIQNADESGIGITNICYDGLKTPTRPLTWGSLKQLYR